MKDTNDIELLKKNNYENKDIYISSNSIFKRRIILDDHIALDPFIYCASNLICRNYVHLSANINIVGGADSYLYVGNFCNISAGCNLCPGSSNFLSDNIISSPLLPKNIQSNIIKPIVIHDFVTIGFNTTILSGIEIAEGCIIGANSFVNKDTEPWTFYSGNPMRVVKKLDKTTKLRQAEELGYKKDIYNYKDVINKYDIKHYDLLKYNNCY